MAHSSGGRLAARPVGGWTSHRKNAPFLYFHTTRDATPPTPWSHLAPDRAVLIPGVNFELNGNNNQSDFCPGTGLPEFCEKSPDFPAQDCVTTAVPQPVALVLLGLGLVVFALGRGREAVGR
jgi:hypothetical protein